MTPILVLTGLELEARGLARQLGLATAAVGSGFAGGRIHVVPVGLAAACLEERSAGWAAPGLVVAAGTCGALDPRLAAGDLVVPVAIVGGGGRLVLDPIPPLAQGGDLVSLESVADTAAAKARLAIETGAIACDMESGRIVAWARERGLPVAVIRGVVDTAGEALPADLLGVVAGDGRLRPGLALRAAALRPRAITQAFALRRANEAALRSVAEGLGRVVRAAR